MKQTVAAEVESHTPRRALIYLRVSTKKQAEKDGDSEGYSIPAQREACRRKAAAMDAQVVGEFVDAGESAKTADRPALQGLLERVAEGDIDIVLVHKVDRLARNRADDVQITMALRTAGVQLVSVTENIDETPSGRLLHGIMASIAEFYSQNLANEIMKGTMQKVKGGGTPSLAPAGYLNVRKMIDGNEVRTIELDPVRAPLLQWAFESYATGDWSIQKLAAELEKRGFTQRASGKRPERPYAPNRSSTCCATATTAATSPTRGWSTRASTRASSARSSSTRSSTSSNATAREENAPSGGPTTSRGPCAVGAATRGWPTASPAATVASTPTSSVSAGTMAGRTVTFPTCSRRPLKTLSPATGAARAWI